jgi:regulator of sirC expression with transglutaminase-like and TPR domain
MHPFDTLLELDEDYVRLDCAALRLSDGMYRGLPFDLGLALLDDLAGAVADKRAGLSAPLRYAAMRDVLVVERGFSGAPDYDRDARNFCLNHGLAQRTGAPVTLSVIWIEVARRLKWPVSGVGWPGHFVVRFDDPDRFVLADPYWEGVSLSLEDCRRRCCSTDGGQAALELSDLRPMGKRGILTRILNNLRAVHAAGGDGPRLRQTLLRLRAIEPDEPRHVRELAALEFRGGEPHTAIERVDRFLRAKPAAHRDTDLCQMLAELRAGAALLN